jgi:hypothetical protein
MRVNPHGVGSVVHLIQRGARGLPIVRDKADRYDFVRCLFLLNDTYQDPNWRKTMIGKPLFRRPETWPEQEPLVSILAWTLLDNHFHLLVREEREGGIAKFMQRLCGSLSNRSNKKYREHGSLFQGGYRGRTVDTDEYLQYVHAYITVKNTFEMLPGGLKRAFDDFDKAWEKAGEYPFCSFRTAAYSDLSLLLNMPLLEDLGLLRKDFKKYARSMLTIHAQGKSDLPYKDLMLEDW